MTHEKLITIANNLSAVKNLKGLELNFAIKKNIVKMAPELTVFQAQEKEIMDGVSAYKKDELELSKKFNAKIKNEQVFEVPADKRVAFIKEFTALLKKHKKALDLADKKWKELKEFRKTKQSDFILTKVKKCHIPEDISTENMALIFDIIRDDDK